MGRGSHDRAAHDGSTHRGQVRSTRDPGPAGGPIRVHAILVHCPSIATRRYRRARGPTTRRPGRDPGRPARARGLHRTTTRHNGRRRRPRAPRPPRRRRRPRRRCPRRWGRPTRPPRCCPQPPRRTRRSRRRARCSRRAPVVVVAPVEDVAAQLTGVVGGRRAGCARAAHDGGRGPRPGPRELDRLGAQAVLVVGAAASAAGRPRRGPGRARRGRGHAAGRDRRGVRRADRGRPGSGGRRRPRPGLPAAGRARGRRSGPGRPADPDADDLTDLDRVPDTTSDPPSHRARPRPSRARSRSPASASTRSPRWRPSAPPACRSLDIPGGDPRATTPGVQAIAAAAPDHRSRSGPRSARRTSSPAAWPLRAPARSSAGAGSWCSRRSRACRARSTSRSTARPARRRSGCWGSRTSRRRSPGADATAAPYRSLTVGRRRPGGRDHRDHRVRAARAPTATTRTSARSQTCARWSRPRAPRAWPSSSTCSRAAPTSSRRPSSTPTCSRCPYVGLALDPEWRLAPDQVHLRQIGSVGVDEVNGVVAWLADFTAQRAPPAEDARPAPVRRPDDRRPRPPGHVARRARDRHPRGRPGHASPARPAPGTRCAPTRRRCTGAGRTSTTRTSRCSTRRRRTQVQPVPDLVSYQ